MPRVSDETFAAPEPDHSKDSARDDRRKIFTRLRNSNLPNGPAGRSPACRNPTHEGPLLWGI
jgi:hypothetical protein